MVDIVLYFETPSGRTDDFLVDFVSMEALPETGGYSMKQPLGWYYKVFGSKSLGSGALVDRRLNKSNDSISIKSMLWTPGEGHAIGEPAHSTDCETMTFLECLSL